MPKKKIRPKAPPKQEAFFMISHGPFTDPKFVALKPTAQILYVHLCRLRNICNGKKKTSDHSFWRWDSTLMLETGLTRSTLYRARDDLASSGFIFVEKEGRGKPPTYTIIDLLYEEEMTKHRDKDSLKLEKDTSQFYTCIEGWD